MIVVPLLQSLKWVHGFVGNWGWSIVILTIIINLVTAPLRHKQVVSMRKMQEIQPEVKAIQDRYSKLKATDPAKQKMNQEMMALYREKKVNPAAGCVPMLLTFPIMFAMWAVLQVSIELRGQPWVGWIHDLSAPDPYYILPVLMVATQFLQQRMMPAAGVDPAQQKMMMFMPLVMGFIFFSLPAGALLLLCRRHDHRRLAAISDDVDHRPATRPNGDFSRRASRQTGRRREDRRRIP